MIYLLLAALLFLLGFALLSFGGWLIIRSLRTVRTTREDKLEALANKYFDKYEAEVKKNQELAKVVPARRPLEYTVVGGSTVPIWRVDRRDLSSN